MATKQFYFICLIGVTLFCGFVLLLLKRKMFDKKHKKSAFFVALGMFSWATIAFYKLFDPPIPALRLSDVDRIFSVFTNIFFVAALPFYDAAFVKFRNYFAFFRKTEHWVNNVFIFFAFLAALFAVIERNVVSENGKNIIVAIDSFFSTTTIGLISFAIYKSIAQHVKDRISKIFVGFFLIFFPSSQFLIPLTAIFPNELNYLYFPFLIVLLLGLVFFSFITISYYSLVSERLSGAESSVTVDAKKQNTIQLKLLRIGYDKSAKVYFIEIEYVHEGVTVKERVENRKILLPFSNWVLFSMAKKLDVKLLSHDIALTKFRMVEYWNKDGETKLSQEFLFINNFGSFEFNVDPTIIEFVDLEHLESKLIISEAIQKHLENFTSTLHTSENSIKDVSDIYKLINNKGA
jgi:hypothetical protein